MTEPLPLSEDLRDALQEVCNVAMGVAGEALAAFSGVFVQLPIPQIRFVKAAAVTDALVGVAGDDQVSAVLRPFMLGDSQGQALVVITATGLADLAQQRAVSMTEPGAAESLLQALTTVITEACLPALATQLALTEPQQGPLNTIALQQPLATVSLPGFAADTRLLTAEINYHLEGHPFNCDLLLLLPDSALAGLSERLSRLL